MEVNQQQTMRASTRRIRESWLREVEDKVLNLQPALAGRMGWYTANYLFNEGRTVDQAAASLVRQYEENGVIL